jgi:chromosome segregation ATPase
MKSREPMAAGDGFDKSVAERMPRIKKEEGFPPLPLNEEPQPPADPLREMRRPERETEEEPISPTKERPPKGKGLEVQRLIEDLHAQLLASSQTRRALELDLSSSHSMIQQYIEDNKGLRQNVDELKKDLQKLGENQAEAAYLREENTDALERIREYQRELSDLKEALHRITQERDDALQHVQGLQSLVDQSETTKIKEKLKEREASHLAEENRELRSRLEETVSQEIDLERKYAELKRSFDEVRESLTFLRDSCRADYYQLSEGSKES